MNTSCQRITLFLLRHYLAPNSALVSWLVEMQTLLYVLLGEWNCNIKPSSYRPCLFGLYDREI